MNRRIAVPKKLGATLDSSASKIRVRPFGSRSDIAKDNIYYFDTGYLFTTPCVATRATFKFYAIIMLAINDERFLHRVGKDEREFAMVATRASVSCALQAETPFVCIHINPLHPLFAAFRAIPSPGRLSIDVAKFSDLRESLHAAYAGTLDESSATQLFEELIRRTVTLLPQPGGFDARIQTVVRELQRDHHQSLEKLAAVVGLSTYRLSHLFSASMGITLRNYIQWKKLASTVGQMESKSMTEIAHEAGFTDLAHFTRTVQQLSGAPPSYFYEPRYVRRHVYLSKQK